VALSDDSGLAAAGGWDGIVRVWDSGSGSLRATLLQPPSQSPSGADWLALAPSGYLAASADLGALARWKVGGAEVAGTVAMPVFGKPEEVARSLRGESVAPPSWKPKG
jgi:WD40 repeat protein